MLGEYQDISFTEEPVLPQAAPFVVSKPVYCLVLLLKKSQKTGSLQQDSDVCVSDRSERIVSFNI